MKNALLNVLTGKSDAVPAAIAVTKLSHGQQIRVKGFHWESEITVGTIAGYALECDESPDEALARAKRFGHSIFPWASKAAAVLTADYVGKAAALQRAHETFMAAPEIEAGQVVEIEGKRYTVKVMGEQFSDPVHFHPVGGAK